MPTIRQEFKKGLTSTMSNEEKTENAGNSLNARPAKTIQWLIAIILGLIALLLIIKIVCIIVSLVIASISVAQLHATTMDTSWVRG